MKLDMLEFQLNEQKVNSSVHDLHRRVRELRALNNSANEICKKIAGEFQKDYDQVKKLLLPSDLKQFVGMTTEQLNKVGEERIKNLTRKYSKHVSASKRSRAGILNSIMDSYISSSK